MGNKLITSYAALGVGLAVVLTFGLTAISNVVERPLQDQFTASQGESAKVALVPSAPEEKPAIEVESQLAAPSAPPSETQEDVSAKAGVSAGAGGATYEGAPAERAQVSKEVGKESYSIASEVPPSPFAGFLVILPYIAAAVAGSVVFVVTRKRVGS